MYQKIQKLCKKHGITVSELERKMEFPRGSIYKWNEHIPNVEKVKKVAEFFDVSIESLLR